MVDILITCRQRGQADEPHKSTAIQLAKLSGFSVIATTAREENRALVASLGATHIFPRGTSAQEIRSAIGPIKLGFDVVSTPETQAFSLEVLDKADDTTLIIVTHPTEATKNNAAPINVRLIIGVSARTKDVSVPFWATVERWLVDGVRYSPEEGYIFLTDEYLCGSPSNRVVLR